MQTCFRQNVVSSKSIAIVYHSFKLDYIAFFFLMMYASFVKIWKAHGAFCKASPLIYIGDYIA